tara:strand:- start:143 stop:1753 length:1611 start_codon:yes stop_codon:yes gene_type:complete
MNLNFNKNEDKMKLLVSDINYKLKQIKLGGGEEKIKKIHKNGKLTARERIDYLVDDQNDIIEIGSFVGYEMYEEFGGCPSGGVVTCIGYVKNRMCVIVANDCSVKAGAWFPITAKKNLRAQEISIENKIPIIYLVDSAGIFLPLQEEIFADKYHFGRIFRNNSIMSSKGITQIAAVMGSCVAGGAYLPILCDESIIVNKTGSIFLAGSHLVKAAIGENIDNEKLGGATTHCEISGVTDYKASDDKDALDKIKNIIDKLGENQNAGLNRKKIKDYNKNISDLYGIIPNNRNTPYDMKNIINLIIDENFEEYKKDYGKTILCGYARLDGWSIGIVANQRKIIKNKKGEIQLGGVIYSDAADKATRFICNCNQKKIPILFIQDVTGFMVGSRAEHGGIIKDGAKLVNAISNSVVPKITLIIGNSFGAGNYAMCGKAFDPRFIFAWPSAEIAVMGGEQASKVLFQIQKGKNKSITKDENKILNNIKTKYTKSSSPLYAASRLWIDEIIDPKKTRKYISRAIEASNHSPIKKKFNVGIIQT